MLAIVAASFPASIDDPVFRGSCPCRYPLLNQSIPRSRGGTGDIRSRHIGPSYRQAARSTGHRRRKKPAPMSVPGREDRVSVHLVVTNPAGTLVFKALICIKAPDALVASCHRDAAAVGPGPSACSARAWPDTQPRPIWSRAPPRCPKPQGHDSAAAPPPACRRSWPPAGRPWPGLPTAPAPRDRCRVGLTGRSRPARLPAHRTSPASTARAGAAVVGTSEIRMTRWWVSFTELWLRGKTAPQAKRS